MSIIIPAYKEADAIGALVQYLRRACGEQAGVEIIVADGQSPDATAAIAEAAGARVLRCPRKGRAAQMNHGANAAHGRILYFLHADSYPPPSFLADIRRAVQQGYGSGCYQLAFDHPHWFLRASAWFTRFNWDAVRFGDQSLFAQREVFEQAGGFREEMIVLEDQEIVGRLRRFGPFTILPGCVTTSARKYLENGIFRLQSTFLLICILYHLGVSQPNLKRVYCSLIRQDKI